MKKYDITDNFINRVHTIRVTFQWQEYKGHIAYEIYGNCRGFNVINLYFDCWDIDDILTLKENDCCFNWNEEHKLWQLVLKDDIGNECKLDNIEQNDINNYVVAVEIIDCRLNV